MWMRFPRPGFLLWDAGDRGVKQLISMMEKCACIVGTRSKFCHLKEKKNNNDIILLLFNAFLKLFSSDSLLFS